MDSPVRASAISSFKGLAASFQILFSLFPLKERLLSWVGFVLLSINPVAEIALLKIIVDVFMALEDEVLETSQILFILILTVSVYGVRYVSRVGRIQLVNKAMGVLKLTRCQLRDSELGWFRAGFLELSNALVVVVQLFLVLVFSLYLGVYAFSLLLLFTLACVLLIRKHFNGEYLSQKKIKFDRKGLSTKKSARQVVSRVKAIERTSLQCNFVMAGLLIAGLLFAKYGYIEYQSVIVFVFVVRFIGVALGLLIGSVMRLARALVHSESSVLSAAKKLKLFYGVVYEQ